MGRARDKRKAKRASRKKGRQVKRAERKAVRVKNRSNRKARKQKKRDARASKKQDRHNMRMAKKQGKIDRKQSRVDNKLESKLNRQNQKTERTALRTDSRVEKTKARAEKAVAKYEAHEAAYENGIDPNTWKAATIGSVGETVSNVAGSVADIYGAKTGMLDNYNMDDKDYSLSAGGSMGVSMEGDNKIYMIGAAIVLAILAFFGFKGKK